MIKIRDPRGVTRYNSEGAWGAKSSKWTAGYRKQADNFDVKESGDYEGIFWVPLSDFMKLFSEFVYAPWNDNFHKTTMDGDTKFLASEKHSHELFTIDNTEVQDVYVACEAYPKNMFPSSYALRQCKERPVTFFLKVEQNHCEKTEKTLASNINCNGKAAVFENLAVGKYYVPLSESGGKTNSYTMTVFAEKSDVKIINRKNLKYDPYGNGCN